MRWLRWLVVCAGLLLGIVTPARADVVWDQSFIEREMARNRFALQAAQLVVPELKEMLGDPTFPIYVTLTDDVYGSLQRLHKGRPLSEGHQENIANGVHPLAATTWDRDVNAVRVFILTSQYETAKFPQLCCTLTHEFTHGKSFYDKKKGKIAASKKLSVTVEERRWEKYVYEVTIQGWVVILQDGSLAQLLLQAPGPLDPGSFLRAIDVEVDADRGKLRGYEKLLSEPQMKN
ncbi:MAG TPA: hypothetical protein VGE59_02350 [Patescibacteria group bacterium]